MKLPVSSTRAGIATLVAAIAFSATVHAATVPATTQAVTAGDQENQYQYVRRGVESEKLREAYQLMAWANNDYKGHRAKAMKSVEDASRLIGMDLKAEGKGHERQHVSDAELHHARELLIEVREIVAGQPRVHEHVNAAIKQLNLALDIK